MSLHFRFAIVSDPHIALPHTIWEHPNRFHLVEVSIPAIETIFERLSHLNLDFLLLPGDLTQHGEAENHTWLAKRLAQLPYPAYVIPGNHDVPVLHSDGRSIGWADFPHYYTAFGYDQPEQLYYTRSLLPGVRLIGLNSNQFDAEGNLIGRLDDAQLEWLRQTLTEFRHDFILVMIHHNVVEHLPQQSHHRLGRRYMLENAPALRSLLREFGVQLVFTGHLHIQDIAVDQGIYDITTGSLVSYPHPYRVLSLHDDYGDRWLQVESSRVESVPGWETLQHTSREFMSERSHPFIIRLLTDAPLNLSVAEAEKLAPDLRYFWADIANGDTVFDLAHFPPAARQYFERFGAVKRDGTPHPIDNMAKLLFRQRISQCADETCQKLK
ncbi:metallophosphoesterase [Leptolyngbya sp. FACHB-36]|uniref:metallophosphoesterase family protein n=1 Tax=Leptolyngbya sp. FACHB-36 TaxID=2692808 RepID=UPI001680E0D7|nr:metallophosphoesterase [Leptolyngbya sp. FACHB-36]MBD2020320.1 metallophosphoesterase [Leptolyngbya sp. FACHB-36]